MATEMEIDSPQPKELFEAAEKGDASLFKSLADQQLNKARALRNDDGRSLLHVAAASGRSEMIRVLSDADPSVSGVNSKDEEGWAPIHSAASCGHHEIVEILIEKGADVNLANDGGRTALHYAASKGQVKIAETLISHGAKINQKDKVGCTPLHRAASTGNGELCELLIEEGAEVDATDRAGQTPLMNAVICANKEGGADFIILKNLDVDGIRIFGSVLGQSIALDHYIRQVDDMVEEFTDINRGMEKTGTFTMKRKKLFQLVGKANSNLADVII